MGEIIFGRRPRRRRIVMSQLGDQLLQLHAGHMTAHQIGQTQFTTLHVLQHQLLEGEQLGVRFGRYALAHELGQLEQVLGVVAGNAFAADDLRGDLPQRRVSQPHVVVRVRDVRQRLDRRLRFVSVPEDEHRLRPVASVRALSGRQVAECRRFGRQVEGSTPYDRLRQTERSKRLVTWVIMSVSVAPEPGDTEQLPQL